MKLHTHLIAVNMKIKILNLKPNSRFHFGNISVDSDTALADTDEYLHSDVLFGALVSNLSQIKPQPEIESFIEAFNNGNILISSAFYCIEKTALPSNDLNKYLFFIPKPVTATSIIDQNNYDKIKGIKKIKFITNTTLKIKPENWKLKNSIGIDPKEYKEINDYAMPQGNFSPKEEINIAFYNKISTPNVNIHLSNKNAGHPFVVTSLQINDLSHFGLKVHFYFLYNIKDESQHANFEFATQLLAYNGVGGERSSGYGFIDGVRDAEYIPSYFTSPDIDEFQMTLSKVIPENKEELSNFSALDTSIRGSRNSEKGPFKKVRMINEGSVFSHNVVGKNEELGTEQIRYGKCISMNIPQMYSL